MTTLRARKDRSAGTLRRRHSLRDVISKLEQWPHSLSGDIQSMCCEMLGHAAGILDAPRMALVWEEEEEPWLHTAFWSADGCRYTREVPDAFAVPIAAPFIGTTFACDDAGAAHSVVAQLTDKGVRRRNGVPLAAALRERFAIGAVLGSAVAGEKVSGHLLALDKTLASKDDLALGEIVAHEIAARLDHYLLIKQLKEAAAHEERVRMARDLHDGVLQSLSAVLLELEVARRVLEINPQTARQRIEEVQQILAAEQRDLRLHVSQLKPYLPALPADDFALPRRLDDLAARIRRQWDLSVELAIEPAAPPMPRALAKEIFLLVQEALMNAVRHAGASALRAHLLFLPHEVRITVTDDGHGFPFRGVYDHKALVEMKRGPVTLRERVISLGGTLTINSDNTGARLDLVVPLPKEE